MKISIRFFNDKEVRAAWNEENNKWYFSVLDIIGAIRKEDNYEKCRNYWKYLKAKLKKENSELVSATTQLKLTAADGKKYMSDALDSDGVIKLAAEFPSKVGAEFIGWFTQSDDTIDGKSKQKHTLCLILLYRRYRSRNSQRLTTNSRVFVRRII